MRIKKWVAVGLLTAASASTFASSWHLMLSSNDESVQFFDAESVEKSRNGVTVWMKYVALNSTGAPIAWSSAIQRRFDCAKKTAQTLARTDYDQNNKFIKSYEASPNSSPVVPDTTGDAILKIVCKPDFPRSTSEKDYLMDKSNDVFRDARVWAETVREMQNKAPQ